MNYQERMNYLHEHKETIRLHGLDMEVRYDEAMKGRLDSLVKALDEDVLLDIASDLSKEAMVITKRMIPCGDHEVEVLVYVPYKQQASYPCIMYMHGGAYMTGSNEDMHYVCKLLCERAQAIVVNVDYRLAPRYAYPQGLMDCLGVLDWIATQRELPIDLQRICVAGDSAGGGLAGACALYERDHKGIKIAYQALIYPSVLLKETRHYKWRLKDYDIQEDKIAIMESMMALKAVVISLELGYLKKPKLWKESYASILMAENHSNLPKTLIVTAEFDYLRDQDEHYARKLKEAGNDVRVIRYGGLQHAFLDHLGYYPQSEDVINQIAHDIRMLENSAVSDKI